MRYMQQEKHTGRRSDGNSKRYNLNCNSRFGFHTKHPTCALYESQLSLFGKDGPKTEVTLDFSGTMLISFS